MIESVGLRTLDADIEPIRLVQTIYIEDSDASITVEPSDEPHYRYELDYGDGPIEAAAVAWSGDRASFMERIAPARTFCLKREADAMSQAGLFAHLSPRDMLVIDENGPIANEYRFGDECAYHKLLDLIGDLALVGRPLIARVSAVRSGHALAHRAARAIIEQDRKN